MPDDLTLLLDRWHRGDQEALASIVAIAYAELRAVARKALRAEQPGHTLQPTALVHETYLRLVPQQGKPWQNREQFFAVCAGLMRRVLVDHARRRRAAKRGSGGIRVTIEQAQPQAPAPAADLLPLDSALTELARIDERRARVVEMRYFAGMSVAEIATASDRPEWDVKKDWKLAKAWLARRLDGP